MEDDGVEMLTEPARDGLLGLVLAVFSIFKLTGFCVWRPDLVCPVGLYSSEESRDCVVAESAVADLGFIVFPSPLLRFLLGSFKN